MKFMTDDDKVILVQSVASANTFISGITGIIKNYILKEFPKNYFRHIYTDTSSTYSEDNRIQLNNKHLNKIPRPSLTISPSISLDDPLGGMGKNYLTSSPHMQVPREMNRTYKTLLQDPDDRFKIYFSSDYITTNIRFKIIVNSFVQATNVAYWLKSKFDDKMYKYINDQIIGVEMPKTYVNIIAKILNLFGNESDPISNSQDMKALELYLKQTGKRAGAINRVTDLTTSKEIFKFGERCNLLTLFTDLDVPEGIVRDDIVEAEYELSFRLQVSAWHPNAFVMTVKQDVFQDVRTSVDFTKMMRSTSESNEGFYALSIAEPISLDRKDMINFTDSDGQTQIGINLLHDILSFGPNDNITHLNLSYLLSPELLKVHSYAVDNNYVTGQLFYIVSRSQIENNTCLGLVDYDKLTVDFDAPVETDIVLDIFINRAMYETLLTIMNRHNFYSKDNALGSLSIGYIDDNNKLQKDLVRVYKLNEEDFDNKILEKSLRVLTPYGIGYVGLVMEGEPSASDYKICLGKDKYNNNIIRCLELVNKKRKGK